MRVGTFPAPWGVQTSTEHSEVGANTPLLRSRRQMPNGIEGSAQGSLLEAKLALGDDMIVSLATEFIENPKADVSKQSCELASFRLFAETLKKEYPRLAICLLVDSLYANKTTFGICPKNMWDHLIT